MILISPLVGAAFRPPAKAIIERCPAGTPLILEAEPSNEFDRNAIKVLVELTYVFQDPTLQAVLQNFGKEWNDLDDPFWLGYIAANVPKRGHVDPTWTYNKDIKLPVQAASLGFDPHGTPLVKVQL